MQGLASLTAPGEGEAGAPPAKPAVGSLWVHPPFGKRWPEPGARGRGLAPGSVPRPPPPPQDPPCLHRTPSPPRCFRLHHQLAPPPNVISLRRREALRTPPPGSPCPTPPPSGSAHVPTVVGTMLFSLRELVQWLGFATFEIFLHGLALLAFSVLLVLKVDGEASALSWWVVFVPFFAADGLSTYFTTIVSVRLFQDGEKRLAVLRLFWILTILSLKFVFEMLLCQKLVEHTRELWYGLIMSPVFILLQLLMIRACRVN